MEHTKDVTITLDEDLGDNMKVSIWFCMEKDSCTLARFERSDGVEFYQTETTDEIKLSYDANGECEDPYYTVSAIDKKSESRARPSIGEFDVCPFEWD